jgi:hypothetical protein
MSFSYPYLVRIFFAGQESRPKIQRRRGCRGKILENLYVYCLFNRIICSQHEDGRQVQRED